jgi:hypothetical protein
LVILCLSCLCVWLLYVLTQEAEAADVAAKKDEGEGVQAKEAGDEDETIVESMSDQQSREQVLQTLQRNQVCVAGGTSLCSCGACLIRASWSLFVVYSVPCSSTRHSLHPPHSHACSSRSYDRHASLLPFISAPSLRLAFTCDLAGGIDGGHTENVGEP